jgi:8-oxo-dGTP diphosphatase
MIDAAFRTFYRTAHLGLRAYWFVRRPVRGGVLVAMWHEGRVLVVKNSYRAEYSFPGGYPETGESRRAAARREVEEETGIRVDASALVHAYHGTHLYEHRHDRVDIFELHLDAEPTVEIDRREVVWAQLLTPDEARALPLVPHLVDYFAGRGRPTPDVAE